MVERRSILAVLPLLGAAAAPIAAQEQGSATSASVDKIFAAQFGAKGDGTTDDTAALQAALDGAVGKALVLEPRRYRTTSTLWITGHRLRIEGCGAILEFEGNGQPAIDCRRIAGRVYPQEIRIRQLDIVLNRPKSSAFAIRLSHSSIEDVYVGLRRGADESVGFDLIGDEEFGTGPYYNVFKNCSVQGQGENQIGVRYYHTKSSQRAPNANTWLGGRVGQCKVGLDVSGCGNAFFNPTLEGCTVAFSFDRATENSIFGCYLEACSTGFDFSAESYRNCVIGIFGTGVRSMFTDRGHGNWMVSAYGPTHFAQGVRFGDPTNDPEVLDAYKEGRWSPKLVCSEKHGQYRVTANNAEYVRVGRQVTLAAELVVDTIQAGKGTVLIANLPFQPAISNAAAGTLVTTGVNFPDDWTSAALQTSSQGSQAGFAIVSVRDGTTSGALSAQHLTARSRFALTATYFIKG